MKAFVITIREIPESVQMAERCIASGKRNGIDIEHFWAFTPLSQDIKLLFKEEGIPVDGFKERWSRLENAMAAFLSHYTLWKRCVADNENYLILEHDAVVKDSIPVLFGEGVMNIGEPSYGSFKTPPVLGYNKLTSKQYFPGAHAYIVSPDAANILVKQAKVDGGPTDVWLHNDRFGFLEEYYPWPVVVDDTFTTIQNESGCQAKHSYKKSPDMYRVV
jgi:GR25 family glycosyltransferase involved in LPS biosynthesis